MTIRILLRDDAKRYRVCPLTKKTEGGGVPCNGLSCIAPPSVFSSVMRGQPIATCRIMEQKVDLHTNMSSVVTNLGRKIREERLKRRMTLADLSQKTGLSKSFLSLVERGITEPSITSLKKIAKEYGYSVVRLFQENNEGNLGGWDYQNGFQKQTETSTFSYVQSVEVVRSNWRKKLMLPGTNVTYDLLTPDMNRQLEVMHMKVPTGTTSGNEPMVDPPGEKMGIILRGVLEFQMGTETYTLNQGDSIYYPASAPHSWRAIEGDPVEVIWILTPPSF